MKKPVINSELFLNLFIYSCLTVFAFMTVYPFIHELSISFSNTAEALRQGFHFFPLQISLDAYRKVFSAPLIWHSYQNTIFVVVVGTVFNMILTTFTAYPLSRPNFPYRNGFTFIIVFTMMFSGGLIPTYLLVRSVGLLDSLWALIIPGLVNAYNMILMKNFFQTIPDSLIESAKIDGSGDVQTLAKIVIPLSAPVLATISLFYAVAHWNAFFDCMIYISDPSKTVLQVILRQLVVTTEVQLTNIVPDVNNSLQNVLPIQEKSAVIMVATIPILILYPFLQKYFVKGILIGAIKG